MLSYTNWLLNEAMISRELIADIKQQLQTGDGYLPVFLYPNGEISLEYPDYRNKLKSKGIGQIYLKRDKEITVRELGDKLNPNTQKLIKELKKAGIIDDTWKIDTQHVTPGEYIGSKFAKLPSQINKRTIDDVISSEPLTKSIKDITLYHGTSSYDWEKIKKFGALTPLFVGKNQNHGSESRWKHQYNKNHLYLATSEDKAWFFAKQRATNVNRYEDPKGWKYISYHGPDRWPIKPVLLKIHVPDIGKLRADDDMVNDVLKNQARKIWERKSPEEKREIMNKLEQQRGFKISDPTVGELLWRETDDGMFEIMKFLKPSLYKAWLASILRYGYVAYDGIIPIKFIEEIPFIPRKTNEEV